MNTAYFVYRPRRMEDLKQPHLVCSEKAYEIVYKAVLSSVDYDNFVSDLLIDREFLEKAAHLCHNGTVMRCILVKKQRSPDGILVVPGVHPASAFVAWAAYCAN